MGLTKHLRELRNALRAVLSEVNRLAAGGIGVLARSVRAINLASRLLYNSQSPGVSLNNLSWSICMCAYNVKVMLSSTIADLPEERAVIGKALNSTDTVELVGMNPGETPSRAGSPYYETVNLAEDCGLYFLILGGRYGYVTELGKSATQLEYEAAYRQDPTKIIVMRKVVEEVEPRQAEFIAQVEDYHKGYLVNRFHTIEEAAERSVAAYRSWLLDRASIGRKLDFFDHFVRIASQRSPFPGAHAEYRLSDDRVELTYTVVGRVYSIHFEKIALYSDFWGSVLHLEKRFELWRSEGFGRGTSN